MATLNMFTSILPPEMRRPVPVRFLAGRRSDKGMRLKDGQGRVRVFSDREQCWRAIQKEFGKKAHLFDVFSLDAKGWEHFKADVPHVEVPPDGEASPPVEHDRA